MKQVNLERIARVMQELADDLRSRAAQIEQQAKELIKVAAHTTFHAQHDALVQQPIRACEDHFGSRCN